MRLKVIACEVFAREIRYCAALSPHTIDIEFTDKGAHDRSPFLRSVIQRLIDATESGDKPYDAILLGFGLCGNAVAGIHSRRLPLVVPRAHDCCTLFLGSRRLFREHFEKNPSMPFSSAGYLERGSLSEYLRESTVGQSLGIDKTYEEYVELYGEENAQYIIDTLKTTNSDNHADNTVVFIDLPETAHLGYAERFRAQAEAEGKRFVRIQGDIGLFRRLTNGEWNDEEFLTVQPGRAIEPTFDWDRVVAAGDRPTTEEKT